MQGQSMFGAEGDTGAFSCIRSDGTTSSTCSTRRRSRGSPAWAARHSRPSTRVTPRTRPTRPAPRRYGTPTPCAAPPPERRQRQQGRLLLVRADRRRGRRLQPVVGPAVYQRGPGVNNPYTTHGNGTTQCALAKTERRAARTRTSPPTPTSTPRTPSTARATPAPRTASAALHQPEPARVVRHRRHQPVLAALVSDHRRPRQLPGPPQRQHQPAAVPAVQTPPHRYFHDITGRGRPPTTTACSR